jgi:hypothetical protein
LLLAQDFYNILSDCPEDGEWGRAVKWLLILGGLAGLLVLVCRWLRSGRDRWVPVAALGFGLVALATPPGAVVSARVGGGLVLLVQVLAWLLAPLAVVAGMVWLVRRQVERDDGTGGRVGLVVLTVSLGLAGAMALHHTPGMPAAGQDLRHAVLVLGRALLRQGEDARCTPPHTRPLGPDGTDHTDCCHEQDGVAAGPLDLIQGGLFVTLQLDRYATKMDEAMASGWSRWQWRDRAACRGITTGTADDVFFTPDSPHVVGTGGGGQGDLRPLPGPGRVPEVRPGDRATVRDVGRAQRE